MPAAILKVLALSGVISAGCFAVWKANSELVPADSAQSEQFTPLPGEADDTIGLGGEPISKPQGKDATPADDQALAQFEFAQDGSEEEPAPSREMPPAFPAIEQSEPDLDPQPTASDPEPGVASLDLLEEEEARNARQPSRIQAASAEVGAAPTSPAVKQLPTRADAPILLPTPTATAQAGAPRTRTPSRVVPANAEDIDTSAGQENGPILPGDLIPEDIEPAASDAASSLPEIRSRGSIPQANNGAGMQINPARARGSSIPTHDTNTATEEPVEENPFPALNSAPGPDLSGQQEPSPEEEVENPFAPRTRPAPATSIPAASSEPEPTALPETPVPNTPAQFSPPPGRQPTRTPTINHSVGEAVEPGAEPLKSSIPQRNISENLLIGEGTIDDPAITPTKQPQIRVEKRAQAEAEIGEKMIYEIIVQNVGQVAAKAVVVEERIPKGTRMERSQPQAKLGRDKVLHWELGTMDPGAQKVIKVEVTPLEAGPIGSVATVRFGAEVATKTVVTAPTLSLSVEHPQEVALGEQVPIHFVVTNTGSGTARNVKLRTKLQEGLQHKAGLDLDKKLGTLAPGQSQKVDLSVTAAEEGRFAPVVIVTTGEGNNEFEQENRTLDLNVIQSRLTLSRDGHVRRFVNRPAEFTTRVMNHSIDVIKDVRITETLPVGVVPVGEMTKYRWNPDNRTVQWTVSQLGPGQYSDLKLNVVSERAGELEGKVEAVAANGQRAELPTMLEVAGFPALKVDIHGEDKPVAVDEQVSMRVTISNKGSAPATSVTALFELPQEMTLISAEGPVQYTQEGKLVTFAALQELAPNEKQTFDIVLAAAEEGSTSVAVDVYSDDRKDDPVRQEEAVTIIPK
jgi:uncharacterized repeat protein (TIGR01451 family)